MTDTCDQLLRDCMVGIAPQGGEILGTGFFFLPGKVITCSHVIEAAEQHNSQILIKFNNKDYLARRLVFLSPNYPDISILEVELSDNPCIRLSSHSVPGDPLYAYGNVEVFDDGILGEESFTFEYEGPSQHPKGSGNLYLSFKSGRVPKGLSGAPVLNLTTGGVCGVIKRTKEANDDFGGWAIPAERILESLRLHAPNIVEEHDKFHSQKPGQSQVFVSGLPSLKGCHGREEYLEKLDNALANEDINVYGLIAQGGMGKTTTVSAWLSKIQTAGYRGVQKVYVWSFYSQGNHQNHASSAGTFIRHALQWFGEQNPDQIEDKPHRLAELIRKQPTLLVLDGLEPLQSPPGPDEGTIVDRDLRWLLQRLAAQNPGLCVITSRIAVRGLNRACPTVTNEPLRRLSEQAGVEILNQWGLFGTEKQFRSAVNEFGGHPLAIDLLGSLIAHAARSETDRHICKYKYVSKKLGPHSPEGSHAQRVFIAYERWLETTPQGLQALSILHAMGLFDRPVALKALDTIFDKPVIEGLFRDHDRIPHVDWWVVSIQYLVRLRLVEWIRTDGQDRLDCHPLVREHFGEELRNKSLPAWREANRRLLHYFNGLQPKEFPDTLKEMEPLFQAVTHGCRAGLYMDVLETLYWRRILRESKHYAIHVLGAIGADLAALSNFFTCPWTEISPEITDKKVQSSILFFTGYDLRALGRLKDSVETFISGLKIDKEIEDWRNAAISSGYLSELYLSLGNVREAEKYATESCEFPEPTDTPDPFMQRTRLSDASEKTKRMFRLANVLHQAGKLEDSEELFRKAENEQKKIEGITFVHSLTGFWFCDLLLSRGKFAEVLERVEETVKYAEDQKWDREVALDKISRARALVMAQSSRNNTALTEPERLLSEAVRRLEYSGQKHYLPFGLLARASLYRMQQRWQEAENDLKEVYEIARWDPEKDWGEGKEWGSMGIFLVDHCLEMCRLAIDEGRDKQEALGMFQDAKKKVQSLGYFRRAQEVRDLEQTLA